MISRNVNSLFQEEAYNTITPTLYNKLVKYLRCRHTQVSYIYTYYDTSTKKIAIATTNDTTTSMSIINSTKSDNYLYSLRSIIFLLIDLIFVCFIFRCKILAYCESYVWKYPNYYFGIQMYVIIDHRERLFLRSLFSYNT